MRARCSINPIQRLGPQLALLFVLGGLAVGSAQTIPAIVIREFNFPEYYPPPNETQLKTLLEGAEAMPQDEGKVFIKDPILKTYHEDGSPGFVMYADNCLYDPEARNVSSPGALEIRTADGQFLTSGEGFLWQDDVSTLTISNRVHTQMRGSESVTLEP